MYTPLEGALLALLRVPAGPPEPPASHARVAVFRASPRYLTYRLLALAIGAVLGAFGLAAAFAATLVQRETAALVAVALAALAATLVVVVAYVAIRVDYDLRYYVVTDRSLRVRHGAWKVEEQTLTYANVQNLRIVQGPLQRLFEISDLKIDTAGGGATRKGEGGGGRSATLAGIENAAEVRDQVLAWVKQAQAGSGLGDLDDELGAHPRRATGGWTAGEVVLELTALRDAATGQRRAAEAPR